MKISFATPKEEKLCRDSKTAVNTLGALSAKKLQLRLSQLLAAPSIDELPHGRPRLFKNKKSGQFALDLHGGHRLILYLTAREPPLKEDGSVDWNKLLTSSSPQRTTMTSIVSFCESPSEFVPDWLTPPGATIQDMLEQRSWTQVELATRTGFTPKHIAKLVRGHSGLSEDAALKLERVLGGSARFWLNLESQYREQLARNKDRETLQAATAWLKELPLADMIRFGWIEKISDTASQVQAVLTYFNVGSVDAWHEQYAKPVAAYRASEKLRRTPGAVSAWLRQGEIQAAELDGQSSAVSAWLRQGETQAAARNGQSYDAETFRVALQEIRGLTQNSDPDIFLRKLQQLCAQAGVAVAIAPAPKGCPVSGATRWLSGHRALILLCLRGKTDDQFWFTFFHEAGHILKHGKRHVFLDIFGEDGLKREEEEEEANAFARDLLIPLQDYQAFVTRKNFSERAIRAFARKQGIAPSIVLARLQYEKRLPWVSPLGKVLTVHFH